MLRASLLLTLALLAACGAKGSYELHWSISCTTGGTAACPITDAKDCADAGLDAVVVEAVRGTSRVRSPFPCFGPLGALAHGPGLDKGPVDLEVTALSPGGQALAGPVGVQTTIPPTGVVSVEVTLPRPPACSDGVDNDRDGLVDLEDPDCKENPSGTSEGPP